MKVELLIDNREGAILKYDAYLTANIKWLQLQMTIGDYAVTVNGNTVAIIERKTLSDYAASLKDGRINNTDKLVALREKTGCRIIYIVETEQKAPVSLDSYHGGIKYANIEANMDHQAMRHNVQFIVTHSAEETAQRLVRLIKHIETMELADLPSGGDELTVEQTTDQLTERIAADPNNVLLEMWACFKGVAVVTASLFAKATSFRSLTENPNCLNGIKNGSRAVSTRTINNIIEGIANADISAKVIACTPGLSLASAKYIMATRTLHQLAHMTVDELKDIEYKEGKKIRSNVAAYLHEMLSKVL